ncbi:MAG: MarR family transcriptional regulator [Candidatus Neomarinimicrobiota bacterium]
MTHYNGSPKEMIALDAWIKLSRARNSVWKQIKPSMSISGLSTSQFAVLEALLHLGPLSQKEISTKLLVSTGNVVTIIDNLERDKFVTRESNPSDRRVHIICLTKKGERMISEIFPLHVNSIVENLSVLSRSEQLELGRLCKKLGIK